MLLFGLYKDMELLFCVVHYCEVNSSKVTEQIWNSKWVYTGWAICTVWLWYLCSSAISNGFIIPWLFGEFRLFRKMCSPLNQRKSLIHICCSKWLCVLWHYRFSCRHPCASVFCQEQAMGHRQQRRRCCTSASSSLRVHPPGGLVWWQRLPWESWGEAGGSQAHTRRNCRCTRLPQL